jgi:hypothetical protein
MPFSYAADIFEIGLRAVQEGLPKLLKFVESCYSSDLVRGLRVIRWWQRNIHSCSGETVLTPYAATHGESYGSEHCRVELHSAEFL